MEGRVVSALDEIQRHPGTRTSTTNTVHEELGILLRPVVEIAAHTAPSIARTYYRQDIDETMDEVYERTISDLILPTILEIAQSDTSPAKRAATLEFFRQVWQETHKANSWLNHPYGSSTAIPAALEKRRADKKRNIEGELLRYWIQAAISCTTEGVFTNEDANSATASRGILAASASLRPSLRHIVQRIKDADDRGATRLYKPVMEMIENVVKKLFVAHGSEALVSSCVKFLEIVVLCCSKKPQESSRRKKQADTTDFSLEDLPEGHPVITREALESIAEYAFTAVRGLVLLGGQVRVDPNILSDSTLASSSSTKSPSERVVAIIKPAALAYLELESNLVKDSLDIDLDRTNIEFGFELAQKSYSLVINAITAVAINRPLFFRDAAICLARRTVQPPEESTSLPKTSVKAIVAHLRASCLTLLRNAMSVTSKTGQILQSALVKAGMETQATKAFSMAEKAESLKTAGRAARNRANIYYEWETSEKGTKRQRETDDALAQIRAAKKARGLGHGIQLPVSMTDQLELILTNLHNLPDKRPKSASKVRSTPVSLNFVIDAIMTNGASLVQEEGKWYARDGGSAWNYIEEALDRFQIGEPMAESIDVATTEVSEDEDTVQASRRRLFFDECDSAAVAALNRILRQSVSSRSSQLSEIGNRMAARLSFMLGKARPTKELESPYQHAKGSIEFVANCLNDDMKSKVDAFTDNYPDAAACLSVTSNSSPESALGSKKYGIVQAILDEALLRDGLDSEQHFQACVNVYVAGVVYAGQLADDKPSDQERKRTAAAVVASMSQEILRLSTFDVSTLDILCKLCDIDGITNKAREIAKKTSDDSIATAAATHAAKVAAEKRATLCLLIFRNLAFQRDVSILRQYAVKCATGLASGRLPTTPVVHDKALKLAMNVLYGHSESMADMVVKAAVEELENAKSFAIDTYDEVKLANETNPKDIKTSKNIYAPRSEKEKETMDRLRKPVLMMMAICARRPEKIEDLFRTSSVDQAETLSRTVKSSMVKLARAVAAREGAAVSLLRVAAFCGEKELSLLLCFMENLTNSPDDDFVEACFKVQQMKKTGEEADPRFIIPIISSMKRKQLIELLPGLVKADDNLLLSALVKMGERVARSALLFRAEPDEENPSLHGMTLCEQLVFLHNLNKDEIGQKRYLSAIKMCLEEDEVYIDRVVMSALDHMSGIFLTGAEKLPLAFMRSCIILVTKHESLHSWIAHVLLPRLVEAKVYDDPRQWEGWMRCAHMLEQSGESGVHVSDAINKLPSPQRLQYEAKWAGK